MQVESVTFSPLSISPLSLFCTYRHTSVRLVTGYWLNDCQSIPGWGKDFSLRHHFDNACYLARPASCRIDTRYLRIWVKWLEHEPEYQPPSSAEVKNSWNDTSSPYTFSVRGVQLIAETHFPFRLYMCK